MEDQSHLNSHCAFNVRPIPQWYFSKCRSSHFLFSLQTLSQKPPFPLSLSLHLPIKMWNGSSKSRRSRLSITLRMVPIDLSEGHTELSLSNHCLSLECGKWKKQNQRGENVFCHSALNLEEVCIMKKSWHPAPANHNAASLPLRPHSPADLESVAMTELQEKRETNEFNKTLNRHNIII